jgi:NAD(P)-dependent dehydrogenase (short-subunit alcohol dehydrogenase family)
MDDSAIRSDFTHNHEELAGRTSIVTGSTSGIGLGIARAFAAAGMNVSIAASRA